MKEKTWVKKLSDTPARGRLIERAAESRGMKVQEWVREVLNRAARRALELVRTADKR